MKLIIAEKPSQAREYAKVLGGFTNAEGYMQSKEYYLTWCAGHLVELANDKVYRQESAWSKEYLPIIPQNFEYVIIEKEEGISAKKQMKIIKELMSKSTSIINGTDADREGELIFLYVYHYLKCKLPYQRLWLSTLTDNTIKEGFKNLKYKQDDPFLINLGKSGYARAITDWLVGVNATQSATLQLGKGNLLTIGRVQTAILKIICERYIKNKNFKKAYRYMIEVQHTHKGQLFYTYSDTFDDKNIATKILTELLPQHTFVSGKKEIKEIKPPLLHTLDSLTIIANAKFGYSSQDVLDTAQKLYEYKMTSYPRTEDAYINDESYHKLQKYLPKLASSYLGVTDFSFSQQKPESVDASKITGSHDAIIPTGETYSYDKLTEMQKTIYQMIISRCLESFSTYTIVERTAYLFDNNSINFTCGGIKVLDIGWKNYTYVKGGKTEEDEEDENALYLSLYEGEKVNINEQSLREIETRPPSIYTDGTLTKDLTNIGKYIEEENPELLKTLKKQVDLKKIQIGTKATRPSIIARLKEVGYITSKGKQIIPTEKGLKFYEGIKGLQVTNIAYTAVLEKNLKEIAEGIKDVNEFYTELYMYTRHIVRDIFSLEIDLELNEKKNLGICPKCKNGKIVEGKKAFGCDHFKQGCNFTIWKKVAGKQLTEKNVKDLLEKGVTSKIKGFTSSKGKAFEAKLKLSEIFSIDFVFEN